MLKVFYYANCESCKNAIRFFKKELVRADYIEIIENPPSVEVLRIIYELSGRDLKKMFNTTGRAYSAMNLKNKMPSMTAEQAFALMSANGKLIKRPILLASDDCIIGFDTQKWLVLAIKEEMNS
ncbi:arsenate reductase family protein [Ignavibacteria bacterium]|nr:Spx/MgsR family RNA polymerase-binding regulatory protein [Bacteroidota bacterium]MCZ2133573.1 Spx/MgsR family RNA polymerase-binding regulatory protein [Bacteroidota bacterium]